MSLVSPAFAEGAYNTMDSTKQDTLTSSNIVESGSGAMVTGVSVSNGTVTVTKSDALTDPFTPFREN